MQTKLLGILVLSLLLIMPITTRAQEKEITGTVIDQDRQPLPGVNIEVEGEDTGTSTDFDGEYKLRAEPGATLKFSSVGYNTVEEQVSGSRDEINVTLRESSEELEEAVVTAYSIKKERKSLGYKTESVSGADVTKARRTNVTDALAGKVSGLNLSTSGNGPASSSKIILRGFNSLTGDNQPLIVVDGVPMSNFLGSDNNDFFNPALDYGNGLSDLNPEDIDDISVLKGGAASAMYGSRAGDGVIEITTKQGKDNPGAGITYSNTLTTTTMMGHPDIQHEFSQGQDGDFINDEDVSWGEKIEGQTVENWNGEEVDLTSHNNIDNFFNTGITENNTVTFQQKVGDNTGLFTSFSYVDDKGMVPETDLKRLNATTRVTTKYGKENRWSTDIKVQYINSDAENRPIGGSDKSYYGQVLTMPTNLNIKDFKEGMKEKGVDASSNWYIPNDKGNPYWAVYNRNNEDKRNRFMLNGDIGYEFADWINVHAKAGSDIYNTKAQRKIWTGGPQDNEYETSQERSIENNFIASVNLHKDNIFGKWSGSFSAYGQIMKQDYNKNKIGAFLDSPNYFSVGNAKDNQPNVSEDRTEKQVNSLFGTLDIDYDDFWFVTVTARNDWSSTLSKDNRSYFYPSVSTSLVFTDMFDKLWDTDPFGDFLTFGKLRGSYAETGNSLDPYELYNTYSIGHDPLGNLNASTGGTLYNENVRAELQKTWEVGLNIRLFDKIDLDVNYYNTDSKRQLIALPMNALSGYDSRMINAGDIQNKGWEVTANANIIQTPDFNWNLDLNFSKNTNKVKYLEEGVSSYTLDGFDDVSITANPGERYGVIMGTRYERVEDESSDHYGERLLDDEGLPTSDGSQYNLGDQTPRANLGITNSFSYKNFDFSFQVDGRFGGEFFAGTMNELKSGGLAQETVVNGERNDFVADGVIADGDGFKANDIEVSPQEYWERASNTGNLGINEENVYSATNVRLRNVQLTYNFPHNLLKNSPLQNVALSLSVNNAWMIYSDVDGLDPEATYAASSNATGFEYLTFPTNREFVFNLTVGF